MRAALEQSEAKYGRATTLHHPAQPRGAPPHGERLRRVRLVCARELLDIAEDQQDPTMLSDAHLVAGTVSVWLEGWDGRRRPLRRIDRMPVHEGAGAGSVPPRSASGGRLPRRLRPRPVDGRLPRPGGGAQRTGAGARGRAGSPVLDGVCLVPHRAARPVADRPGGGGGQGRRAGATWPRRTTTRSGERSAPCSGARRWSAWESQTPAWPRWRAASRSTSPCRPRACSGRRC